MDADWEKLKTSHPIGTNVRAKVIQRVPYGVWVDAGLGFPTLLEVVCFRNMTDGIELANYPAPGEIIDADIAGYQEAAKQVYLTQQPIRA